jgi:hypothetical protein
MNSYCRKVASEFLKTHGKKAQEHIELHCRMEMNRPFTLNYQAYSEAQEDNITDFHYFRSQEGSGTLQADSSTTHSVKDTNGSHSVYGKGSGKDGVLSLLAANGIHLSSTKQLSRLLDHPDEYKAELVVMSQVLAYFQISSTRMIDVMPMIFETVFARDFAYTLEKNLTSKLQLTGKAGYENCGRFAKEEPEVQAEREDFEKKRDILVEALSVISTNFK